MYTVYMSMQTGPIPSIASTYVINSLLIKTIINDQIATAQFVYNHN